MTAQPLLRATFFADQYSGSYQQVVEFTSEITHKDSLIEIVKGVNYLNWQVGHIVVARTNFLVSLDVPSIWPWEMIKMYIPGSSPQSVKDQAVPFKRLLADLDRTQELLLTALNRTSPAGLQVVRDGKTIAEHLAFYAAHEAGHAGQIELLGRLLRQGRP